MQAYRPRSAARAEGAGMNTPNVHAGRLERRVRRVVRETMPGIHGFCSLFPFGAICGKPLLRLTAVFKSKRQDLTPFFRVYSPEAFISLWLALVAEKAIS